MQRNILFILGVLITLTLYFSACARIDNIILLSEPPGAKVYLIPLFEFEQDTTIIHNNRRLEKYAVPEGVTPVYTRAREKVFIVVFDLEGRKEITRLDVIRGMINQASVKFDIE